MKATMKEMSGKTILILVIAVVLTNWSGNNTKEWKISHEEADVVVLTKSEFQLELDLETMETEPTTPLTFQQSSNQTTTVTQHNNNEGIPKIIHLIWLSARNSSWSSQNSSSTAIEEEDDDDGPLPDYVVNNVKRYKELHTDYKVIVWRNKHVLTTFPELARLVKILTVQKKYLSWMSDILRYALLVKFGGIYLDTDFDILRSLEPLRAGFPNGFTVCVLPTDKDKLIQPQDIHSVQDLIMPYQCTNVNCQMGAPPQHPVLLKSFDVAMSNSEKNLHIVEKGEYPASAFVSGPVVWTNAVQLYNFTTLIAEVFYPCPVQKRGRCNSSNYLNDPYAFAMHKWAASWKKNALKDARKRQRYLMQI